MLRGQLIEAVQARYGEKLVVKKKESMDGYYVDQVKTGRGVFWIDHKKSAGKGYRVHLQKIKPICDAVKERGYGGYPVVYLSRPSDLADILQKLENVVTYYGAD